VLAQEHAQDALVLGVILFFFANRKGKGKRRRQDLGTVVVWVVVRGWKIAGVGREVGRRC
jgi:hypothetical protein